MRAMKYDLILLEHNAQKHKWKALVLVADAPYSKSAASSISEGSTSQSGMWTLVTIDRHACAARSFFERAYCVVVAPPRDQCTEHVKNLKPT